MEEGRLKEFAAPALRKHIHFHPQVPHEELLSRIAEHDIGYAGEIASCANKNLTIANKVFQYLLAGVPVLASDTAGQLEVQAAAPNAIQVFGAENGVELAARIDRWSLPEARHVAAAAALAAARDKLGWQRSAATIREAAARALRTAPAPTLPVSPCDH